MKKTERKGTGRGRGLAALRRGSAQRAPPSTGTTRAAAPVPAQPAHSGCAGASRTTAEMLAWVKNTWEPEAANFVGEVDVSCERGPSILLRPDSNDASLLLGSDTYSIEKSSLGDPHASLAILPEDGVVVLPASSGCSPLESIHVVDGRFTATLTGGSLLRGICSAPPLPALVEITAVECNGRAVNVQPVEGEGRYKVTSTAGGEVTEYIGQWSTSHLFADGEGEWSSVSNGTLRCRYVGHFEKGTLSGVGRLDSPLPSEGELLSARGRFQDGMLREGDVFVVGANGEERRVAARADRGDWAFHTTLPRPFNAPPSEPGTQRPSNTTFVVTASACPQTMAAADLGLGLPASCAPAVMHHWASLWGFPARANELLVGIRNARSLTKHFEEVAKERKAAAEEARSVAADTTRIKKAIQSAHTKAKQGAQARREAEEAAVRLGAEIELAESQLQQSYLGLDEAGAETEVNPLTYRALLDRVGELEAAVTTITDGLATRKKAAASARAEQQASDKQRVAEQKRIDAKRSGDRDLKKKLKVERDALEEELIGLNTRLAEAQSASDTADAESRAKEDRLRMLKERESQARSREKGLDKLLVEMAEEVERLSKDNAALQGRQLAAAERLAAAEKALAVRQEEQSRLKQDAEEAQRKADEVAAEIGRVRSVIAGLEAEKAQLSGQLLAAKSESEQRAARHQRSLKSFADRLQSVNAEIEAIELFQDGARAVQDTITTPPSSSSPQVPSTWSEADDTPQLAAKLASLKDNIARLRAEKESLLRAANTHRDEPRPSDPQYQYKRMSVPELKVAISDIRASNKALKATIATLSEVVQRSAKRHEEAQAEVRILRSKGIDPRTQVLQEALDSLDAEAAVLRESAQRIPQLEAKLMALEEQSLVKQASSEMARRARASSSSASSRPHHLPSAAGGLFAYQQWKKPTSQL